MEVAAGLPVPPALPRGSRGTANSPSGTCAPARPPTRSPRALPPHLPPLILPGRQAGKAGPRRKGREARSPAWRLSPGAATEPLASPLPNLRGPLPLAASARTGAGPRAGSARARAVQAPGPRAGLGPGPAHAPAAAMVLVVTVVLGRGWERRRERAPALARLPPESPSLSTEGRLGLRLGPYEALHGVNLAVEVASL